ncbi:MAG TPA: 50S ribosomal protein L9 [Nevskiaceae bacterium]|nr:50S ribosomal protein L9 [Nevskiaceae bacterium]
MELILLEKVKHLGDLGETVKVRSGFGRNYLLPQGKALTATDANRKVFEERKAELVKKAQDSLGAAKLRAKKLTGATITVRVLASDEGKLYGSVGPAEVARAAVEQGYDIHKNEIDMPAGVAHAVGTYTAVAQLHSELEVELAVVVEAQTH